MNVPKKITVRDRVYRAVLFKVHNQYENGTPEDLTLIPDDLPLEIIGGEQFFVGYVLETLLEPKDEEARSP